jgi:hypothetical protein
MIGKYKCPEASGDTTGEATSNAAGHQILSILKNQPACGSRNLSHPFLTFDFLLLTLDGQIASSYLLAMTSSFLLAMTSSFLLAMTPSYRLATQPAAPVFDF